MLIDTHAHLDLAEFDRDRPAVLERAKSNGVDYIINVGFDQESSRRSIALAARYPQIFAAVGVHPHDAAKANPVVWAAIPELAAAPKVMALGEIGLDYYRDLSPRAVQQAAFRRQIGIAKDLNLPIIVHNRDAHADVLRILKEEKAEAVGGVLHCFSGSWEVARECLELGFYISFAGPVTFTNAPKLQAVAQQVPLDRLLVETDCPYLAPVPHRGKRNESSYVRLVAEKIAALRDLTFDELAAATTANARRLFGF
jgi:TatD DNase family protein